MEFVDRTLRCVDCGADFVWTGGEQAFFADKNFKNEPKRCRACKAKRSERLAASPAGARDRVETRTGCSGGGKEATGAFRPTQGGPAFGGGCFQQRKHVAGGMWRRSPPDGGTGPPAFRRA